MNWNATKLQLFGLLSTFILLFSNIVNSGIVSASTLPSSQGPDLTAQSAILMDLDSGQVLYEKNPDVTHYPASITKILTAILALEHSKLTDLVTTSKFATEQDGNRIYLVVGEQETMENMLYGLLMDSGNDAAVAIAEHVAGSVPAFADMMNAKAKEIGATHSHFVTPNGLHDPNHYTTAHDMACIARYAMQIPEFRKIVSTEYRDWHGKEWSSTLVNLNRLLWTYDGTTGIKTGFTDQAQQTAVISAKRGDLHLLAVLMDIQGLNQARDESATLLDYGFQHFQKIKLASRGESITSVSVNGQQLKAHINEDIWFDQPIGSLVKPTSTAMWSLPQAPFTANTKIGTVTFDWNNQTLVETPLLADHAVNGKTPKTTSHSLQLYSILVGVGFLFLVALGIRKRKRKLENSNYTSYYR